MPKKYLEDNVYTAAKKRIDYVFDNFKKIYVSFSGGKDSTVMLYLAIEEAKKRNQRIGVFIVDLEGQYKITIQHMENLLDKNKEYLDIYLVFYLLPSFNPPLNNKLNK